MDCVGAPTLVILAPPTSIVPVPVATRLTFWLLPPAVNVNAPVPVIDPVEVPVPPYATATAVPCQTPVPMVPTLVSDEARTAAPSAVAESVVTPLILNVLPVAMLRSLLTVVVPVDAPMLSVVAAPAKLTVVAFALTRLNDVDAVSIAVPIFAAPAASKE